MNRPGTRTTTLALGLALALGTPAAANAATYCVKGPCDATPQTHVGLGQAVAAAAANPGKDRIEVGSGSLAGVNVVVQKGNPVDIVGRGRESTTLIGGAGVAQPVIKLGDPDSTISALRVRMGSGASGGGLALSAGHANGVNVVDGPDEAPTTAGAGVVLSPGTSLESSAVVLTDYTNASLTAVAASASPGLDTTIDDTEITGGTGLAAFGTGTVRARRLFVYESQTGVVSRTTTGELYLTNSVIDDWRGKNPVALAAAATTPGAQPKLTVRGVTAVASGAETVGVSATSSADGGDASVSILDSIVWGFGKSLVRNASKGQAGIGASYSDYDPSRLVEIGDGGIMAGGSPNVDPGFADDTANEYELKASSPLVDAGTFDAFEVLEGTTDLAFRNRFVDGDRDGTKRVDMGAYEFQPVPQPQPQQPAQQPQPNGQTPRYPVDPIRGSDLVAPKLSGASLSTKKVRRGSRKPLTVRFGLSEQAKVDIQLERRVGRRWKPVPRAEMRFALKAGTNTVALTGNLRANGLKAGSYRVSMFARDANANGSNSILLPFRVMPKGRRSK